MTYPIGFLADWQDKTDPAGASAPQPAGVPRKSLVQVRFPHRGGTLAYYNDRFDLHRGDLVFVEGKLEGVQGCVVEVCYTFKIRVSDYKRVIAVADTQVHGQFYLSGTHAVTFDPAVLPVSKVMTWYFAPQEEGEFVRGSDDIGFRLKDPKDFLVSPAIWERGQTYYLENRVAYLCLDGCDGYAIVQGSNPYTVEFQYRDGEIYGLVCSCFCSYRCKHEVAVLLQLQELLDWIGHQYPEEYQHSSWFAAVSKEALFHMVLAGKYTGSILL